MPQLSERKAALQQLETLIPAVATQALSAQLRLRVRMSMLYLFYFDELLQGDIFALQLYRACKNLSVRHGIVLVGLLSLQRRITRKRYFLDRGGWRGLKAGRLEHVEWLMKNMDENWFISQVSSMVTCCL
jgi:hypothetical protein